MNSYFSKTGMVSGADKATAAINVAGTADVWTVPLPIGSGKQFSLEILAAGAAIAVNIDIEIGNELPTNYNAADGNFVQYEGYSSPLKSITTAGRYIIPIAPGVAKFIRIKLDGQSGNHATTTYITVHSCKISGC